MPDLSRMIPYRLRPWQAAFLILAVMLAAGCGTTPPVAKINRVDVCVDGRCDGLTRLSSAEIASGIGHLLLASKDQPYQVCDADPKTRKCKDDDISMYIQGGPIPGVGSIKKGRILDADVDPRAGRVSYRTHNSLSFIGVPLITTDHKSRISIEGRDRIQLKEDDYYTNWMGVGNQVMSFSMALDLVDLDTGRLGGYYSWSSTGIGMGKGSGYAILTFPERYAAGSNWLDPGTWGPVAPVAAAPPETPAKALPPVPTPPASAPSITPAPTPSGDALATKTMKEEQVRIQAQKQAAEKEAEKIRLQLAKLQAELEQQKAEAAREEAARKQAEIELEKTRLRIEKEARERAEAQLAAARAEKEAEEKRRAEEQRRRREAWRANFGTYRALVIGNNEYRQLPRLHTAVEDARAVADLLRQDYGFDVSLLLNATRAQVMTALSRLRRTLTESDNLLIYYAGHGWLDRDADEGYWLPVDAQMDNEVYWISNSSITTALKAMKAKHVMVVADSCYSGKLIRGVKMQRRTPDYLAKIARLKARVVLASGGLEPVADSGRGNHSVFANAFIRALKENQDILDGTRLFSTIRRPVMVNSDQTPQYADIRNADHGGGDFIFVRVR